MNKMLVLFFYLWYEFRYRTSESFRKQVDRERDQLWDLGEWER